MTTIAVCAGEHTKFRPRSTGKERDYASGNDYFGARYYSSNMGRFMSPDDGSDQDASDPQSWNLYGYARNNPLSNTDPTGNACVENSDGSTHDDSSGGESCADVAKAPQVVSAIVIANLSVAPTLQDASDFYQMWLSGVGPSTLNYGPNDGATKQLERTPTAQGLRQKYIDAGCPSSASYPSGHMGPWLHGYGTLNPTEMQVGGFNESMSTSGGNSTFAITNTAGQASYSGATTSQTAAALNPFNSSGTTDNPYGPTGPRHNINQTFSWTEPNPCGH